MKHMLYSMVLITALTGCNREPIALQENYSQFKNIAEAQSIVDSYHIHPSIFGGDTVFNESNFLIDGGTFAKKTIFPIEKIVSIKNHSNTVTYKEGQDYTIKGSEILFNKDSNFTIAPKNFLEPHSEDKRINFNLNSGYRDYQTDVTYKKTGTLPLLASGDIKKLRKKVSSMLVNGGKFTFYGDSITFGSDSTYNTEPPFQPPYYLLTMSYLNSISSKNITWMNTAVGGWDTRNAKDDKFKGLNNTSDIYVIAFGINDSAVGIDTRDYEKNLKLMINRINKVSPNASIILLSSIMPNPEWTLYNKNKTDEYEKVLNTLSIDNDNVVSVNLTEVWRDILKQKSYVDITGNGINHPNDFGYRIIAEALLTTLAGNKFR